MRNSLCHASVRLRAPGPSRFGPWDWETGASEYSVAQLPWHLIELITPALLCHFIGQATPEDASDALS